MRAVGGHQMAPPHSPGVAPDAPLDAALAYAARGWRVVPIIPGQKRPPLGQWTDVATCDPDRIRQWWGGRYADHGVGIVCGWNAERTACLFVVDVDEGHTDGVSGGDTLAELEAAHGALPATMEVVTGSGGRHLYFVADEEVGTGANRLGPGVDTRGEGGQVLAPPTYHPNGTRYEWEASSAAEPASAPAWLLDLLRPTAPPTPPPALPAAADAVGQRPGDLWAAQTTWAELLEVDGWTLHHVDRDGEQHWTRPGKDRREGTSATLGYRGSDVLKVFTSSVPWLTPDATYSRLGYLAARDHNGDHRAAARALAAEGWTIRPDDDLDAILPSTAATPPAATPEGDGWPIAGRADIEAVLSGSWEPPTPSILHRSDGQALIYPGKVHSLSGEPGAAKTWVALHAVAEVLAGGGRAALIDHEDRLDTAVRRLAGMGVAAEIIIERFAYVTPTFAVKGGGLPVNVIDAAAACDLVVIDSLGEALAHTGLNQNDDGEVANYLQRVARRCADGGAAVLLLDHVTKDSENRGRWSIGSQRKLAAIDGAAYTAQAIKALTMDSDGLVKVICAKDRGGNYRQGSTVAMITLTPNAAGVHIAIEATEGSEIGGRFRPTFYMEKVSRYLEGLAVGVSKRTIAGDVEGKATVIRAALDVLVEEGFVAAETRVGRGGGNLYRSIEKYRDDVTTEPRPTASNRVPDAVAKPRPENTPPPTGGGFGDAVRTGPENTPETRTASRTHFDLDYEPII